MARMASRNCGAARRRTAPATRAGQCRRHHPVGSPREAPVPPALAANAAPAIRSTGPTRRVRRGDELRVAEAQVDGSDDRVHGGCKRCYPTAPRTGPGGPRQTQVPRLKAQMKRSRDRERSAVRPAPRSCSSCPTAGLRACNSVWRAATERSRRGFATDHKPLESDIHPRHERGFSGWLIA